MPVEQGGINVECVLKIENGLDLSRGVAMFRWKSMINDGYSIYARIFDPNLSLFQQLTNEKYLRDARRKPLRVSFKLKHITGGDQGKLETVERIAFMTNLEAKVPDGGQTAGFFEFIAIDPPTWYLNRGDADGSVWKGSVSDVIKNVISQYAPGIQIEISDTIDSSTNIWHMMRQDPKTFIMTLLDWSASVTNNKTNWVVASVDEKIIIKEQAELVGQDLGEYAANVDYPSALNIISWERQDNNYLTNIQTKIMTAGISAVSGLYCDNICPVTADDVLVFDENTPNKKNVRLNNDQGFIKPKEVDIGWTMVRSIPEDSAGSVGIQYRKYIDGRARALYIGILDVLNRLKIKIHGSTKFDDSSLLGASTVYCTWTNSQYEPWTHNGNWMVYGFEHVFTPNKEWYTYLYINRKDVDASADIIR